MGKRDDLILELKRINFYWKELSEGKSEEELERILAELKEAREMIKIIFPFKIMGNN